MKAPKNRNDNGKLQTEDQTLFEPSTASSGYGNDSDLRFELDDYDSFLSQKDWDNDFYS